MVPFTRTPGPSLLPTDAKCSSVLPLTMLRNNVLYTFVLALVLFAMPSTALAQAGPPRTGNLGNEKAPAGPTPRTTEGRVDFSGVWDPGFSFANLGQVPLQPWALKLYDERRASLSKDDPEARCLPAGVPRISPFPQKFVQTP